MTRTVSATLLDDAISSLDVSAYGDRVEVLPAYSGRGMFGDTCLGVVMNDSRDLVLLGQALGLGKPSLDSMGLSSVGYWQGVTLVGTSRHQEQESTDVECDECFDTSESGWGDTPLCVDCQREEDPSLVCEEHLRTHDGTCPLEHGVEVVAAV